MWRRVSDHFLTHGVKGEGEKKGLEEDMLYYFTENLVILVILSRLKNNEHAINICPRRAPGFIFLWDRSYIKYIPVFANLFISLFT